MEGLDSPWRGSVDGVVVVDVSEVEPDAVRRRAETDELVVVRGPDRSVARLVGIVDHPKVVSLPDSVPDAVAAQLVGVLRQQQRAVADVRARTDRMELDLRHAQKMDAVGQLASGIAHEINTPVQFIGDSLFFLRGAFEDVLELVQLVRDNGDRDAVVDKIEEIDLDFLIEEVPRALDRTKGGTERVSTIVRAMRHFARADQMDAAPADIEDALQSTVVVANNRVRYHADVVLDLETLPMVECRIGDLNQVFLNLLVNAADAIEDAGRGRGTITVAARPRGDMIEVRVTDTGCGIPDEVRERIFEPFFTTKEVGRGTGQGLAISHAIVVRHHGDLSVESTPGEGTTFVVRLPVSGRRAA